MLAAIVIVVPFDRVEFCRQLGERRQRPILLYGVDTAAEGLTSGLWLGCEDCDVVVYDNVTTEYHQDAIVLHEVGHILFDHYADQRLDEDAVQLLLPSSGGLQVDRIAARDGHSSYSAHEEQEAEFFARLVLGRVASDSGAGATGDPQRQSLLEGLSETFEA